MTIRKVTAVYFSPTGNSKRYVCEIAKRLQADFREINLTDFATRRKEFSFAEDELVVFGAPVYAGRLPQPENKIFARLQGSQTPAIFVVTYGNREFEDSLLEMQESCEVLGFRGIAAGAFVAPHTFSSKIAADRPNADDWAAVEDFVRTIRKKLADDNRSRKKLIVKGNSPYKEATRIPFVPTANESCTGCGICVSTCPVQAIPEKNPETTDGETCIACFACVKICPENSRFVRTEPFAMTVQKLEAALTITEKKPELFYCN